MEVQYKKINVQKVLGEGQSKERQQEMKENKCLEKTKKERERQREEK